MSASIRVFFHQSRVPNVEEWNAAIKAEGFRLILDPFDLRTANGFQPGTLNGEEAAFDWYLGPVTFFDQEPDSPGRAQIAGCDLEASLGFGSSGIEGAAASIAAAVLAKMTGGWYMEPFLSDKLSRGDEAIAAARRALEEWQKENKAPKKFVAAATTSVMVPLLKPLGFVRVRPLRFARLRDGIVQDFWIHQNEGYFEDGWNSLSLYPLREFSIVCLGTPKLWFTERKAETQAQTNAAMQELADAFMKEIYPWLDETRTDADYLDYWLEFGGEVRDHLLDKACLQARLGRMQEAIHNLMLAVLRYEDCSEKWSVAPLAMSRELLAAIDAGTTTALLDKWKAQSIQNLGYKKLLEEPRKEAKMPPPTPGNSIPNVPDIPPIIATSRFRTAAAFSREVVRPAIIALMARVMPDFRLFDFNKMIFIGPATAGLFEFVIFSQNWPGAFSIHVGVNYDANSRAKTLGGSRNLAEVRDTIDGILKRPSRDSKPQPWYHYGRSEAELHQQLLLAGSDLAEDPRAYFISARKNMNSAKLLQFGLRQVIGNPLADAEKSALKRELSVRYEKPVTHPRLLELKSQLKQFASQHPDIPQDERDHIYSLAEELLLANLSPDAMPPG